MNFLRRPGVEEGMSEHAPVCDHPLFTYQPAWAHGERGARVGHVTHTVDLPIAPTALWSALSDPRTWSDWLTVHQRWIGQPRTGFVPGARMTAETLMLGVSGTVEWTVESAIAPGTLVLIGTGAAGLRTRFTVLVNAFMLQVTEWIADPLGLSFVIDEFWWDAIWGAIIISIVSMVLDWVIPDGD